MRHDRGQIGAGTRLARGRWKLRPFLRGKEKGKVREMVREYVIIAGCQGILLGNVPCLPRVKGNLKANRD